MKTFDVELPVTIVIQVQAGSAQEAAVYLHDNFKATNGTDPLAGHVFHYRAYALVDPVFRAEIKTCVVDVPANELEVSEV